MIEYFFILSILLIIHAYFGYPLSLCVVSLFKKRNIIKSVNSNLYNVTIIIAAYNADKLIKDKIDNILNIDYPKNMLQVIVASDGSTDKTNDIVLEYAAKGIELLPLHRRGGKEIAQMEAIKQAKGEILVFTDVGTMLDPLGIKQIASNFCDPSVGCVSGEDRLIEKDGKSSGEGFYVRYEMWLRKLESRVNSLVGLSGSFFAARSIVCRNFSKNDDSDFHTLLSSIKMGLRGISDPLAIGYYNDISDQKLEYERKVRTVLRGITGFFNNIEYLNIIRYGMFSYQYFCHKLLRWLVPAFLMFEFLLVIILSDTSSIYLFILIIQLFVLSVFVLLKIGIISSVPRLLYLPIYFITVNLSICVAWFKYLRHERIVTWNPSER